MKILMIHFVAIFVYLFLCLQGLTAQEPVKQKKLFFKADLRARAEQDWDSRKSDGTYRDDRFRVRFRVRAQLEYKPKDWATFGLRMRTGYPEKQQDPHLTIGDGYHEFESVPIGFDKLYFKYHKKWFTAWVGRNTFPFEKTNELFWSDNVWLDGVYLSAHHNPAPDWIDKVTYAGGMFTMLNSFSTFADDSFMGIVQIKTEHFENRLRVFPGFFHFNRMPDIPDGNETFRFEYSILQFGAEALVFKNPRITMGLDLYRNLQNYNKNDAIEDRFKNQKNGFVGSIVWGDLSKKGDFALGTYITYLERYAAVDFIAQNDWVRWDYSGQGSRDGRLTNYKGIEIMSGYRISKMLQLKVRYFIVEQLLAYGPALENGNRIRFDIDFRF
ncbi:putative porin [Lutimonas sp.]|uniref:putative porin n=1 Tax=Lutimonas sp. TaxID=1872403 RepID=UPI003D9AFA36